MREFAPKEANRFAAMLGRIMRFEFEDPTMTSMEEFEQLVKEYQNQSKDNISDSTMRGVVISGIKNERLSDHLILNASRLCTFKEVKGELKHI